MGELGFNNIFSGDFVDTLFDDPEDNSVQEEQKSGESPENKNSETDKTTEVVDPESLFEDEPEQKPEKEEKKAEEKEEKKEEEKQPESVGSGDKSEEKGDATTEEDSGTSPEILYSSIANALAVDGVFPNLDEETLGKVKDAESLSEAFEAEVMARFEEKQQRLIKALENGVEPADIRRYENTLSIINQIKDDELTAEDEKGEQLRRNLIYQDFINKKYSPERAQKLTQRAIDNGTDVEDAKEALQANREFFQGEYDRLLEDAEKEAQMEKAERQKQSEQMKESLLKGKNLMGELDIDQGTRKKAFENLTKPVYKDPETGDYLTEIQKYEMEHRPDFLKYVSLFYTMTKGFKDFKALYKEPAKKELKKGLRELEQTLSNTKRNSDGSLKMVTTVKDDPESYLGEGFRLDI